MTRNVRPTILFLCGLFMLYQVADAADPQVPEPFQGFNDNSKYTISYEDLSDLLRRVVVDVGTSTRAIAAPSAEITGTRMKHKVKRLTQNEGNRFFYQAFEDNDAGQQYLRNIQKELEALPSEIPLAEFSRDEQLAFWLNLYNVTVLNEIVAVYPKNNLKKLVSGKKSIFSMKLLTVADIPLSLDDIQNTILKHNYDNNPLIIYGLYQGVVGGPNIRISAYNGDDVYRALEDNAFEFVNSNRGTFSNDEVVFRVSSYYDRNKTFFPEFDSDLSKHLLDFLEGEERDALQAASKIKPNISDFRVTDLGGTQARIGGSFAHNNAALLDSYRGNRQTIFGGVLTAPVVLNKQKVEPDDDTDSIEDRERYPVDNASIEEVVLDDDDVQFMDQGS